MMSAKSFFSFPTSIGDIIGLPSVDDLIRTIHPKARALYELYEADFLYLDDQCLLRETPSISNRERTSKAVFHEFNQLLDPSRWEVSTKEIVDFFWHRVAEEDTLLSPGTLSLEYREIAERADAKEVCCYYLSQFALDYLTEASPLTRALPGSFGDIQMAIFKIVDDEFGNGNLEMKHSVLFQSCLRSLGMPQALDSYRKGILNSIYLYMSYVNQVAHQPDQFFRFLGFLFVYEACLIFPTQQQGLLIREIFGSEADTRYFDFHVEIDKGHGVWVVETMLVPTVHRFGEKAAREILKGYLETNLLLRMCDAEIDSAVREKRHCKQEYFGDQ